MPRDNDGYYDRARQPLGYGQEDRRRVPAGPRNGISDRPGARPQTRPQQRRDYPSRSEQPRGGRRSRLLAVIMLVTTALVIVVTGLAIGDGAGSPGSEAIPFELLPLPASAVTTTT